MLTPERLDELASIKKIEQIRDELEVMQLDGDTRIKSSEQKPSDTPNHDGYLEVITDWTEFRQEIKQMMSPPEHPLLDHLEDLNNRAEEVYADLYYTIADPATLIARRAVSSIRTVTPQKAATWLVVNGACITFAEKISNVVHQIANAPNPVHGQIFVGLVGFLYANLPKLLDNKKTNSTDKNKK